MPSVEIKGGANLYAYLKNWEPQLAKELSKEISGLLRPITQKAKGYIPSTAPLSGWAPRPFSEARFPFYNANLAKRGIVYKSTPSKPDQHGFSYAASIYNKSRSGAIYETAGRKNPFGQPWDKTSGSHDYSHSNNPYAGRQFIAALQAESPLKGKGMMRGRAIFRAWDEDGGKTNAKVIYAIENTHNKLRAKFKVA